MPHIIREVPRPHFITSDGQQWTDRASAIEHEQYLAILEIVESFHTCCMEAQDIAQEIHEHWNELHTSRNSYTIRED